ncbi:TKL protein kinase [Saprolegnia parasitica CBS 223.65]|uniref:TKL protein kinase n=1 Tax=Saprolegnia parasitica (strain CBS 223.65) TaxID=695850 RepID=A0A067CSJ7_SAPPC|nr:TKL protein kinase [Saprolegnia parasitica CBS 223.65]KDO33503.1 TKL protein kinase [Saprolegnia parasitica CBS 223.65]|eukprot:XP_012196246.1 TKL protein kinase [Saprolegnia parasitica CBS 223.65]
MRPPTSVVLLAAVVAAQDVGYKAERATMLPGVARENVTRPTFTTKCDACNFSEFRKPTWRTNVDDSTCIWHADGSCTIGVNLNENDIPMSDWPGGPNANDKKSTQFLMGTGSEVSYVEGLSSVVSYITLFRLGIETLALDLTSNKRAVPNNRAVEATQLNFSDNHIRSIDGVMTSDQTFNLFVDRNWIESVGDISTMKQLRVLNLNANRIVSIERTVWPTKLEVLFLDSNQLVGLPKAMATTLRRLVTLSLQNNSIASLDGVSFGESLASLNLKGNALRTLNNVALPYGLASLNLVDNNLTWINASILPHTLVDLCLKGNPHVRFAGSAADLTALQNLSHADPACNDVSAVMAPTSSCPEVGATAATLWNRYLFCVVPIASAEGHSATSVLTIALGVFCALALLVGGGVVYEMRRRRLQYEAEHRSWLHSSSPTFPSLNIADSAHLINDLRFDPAYQRYRIPADSIVRDRVLARGGFGIVYLATLQTEKGRAQLVAVKRMLPERLRSLRSIEDFMEEIRFCIRLQHPHIVEFIGYCWTTLPNLSVVTEYMSEGDLWTLLDTDHDAQRIPWHVQDEKDTVMLAPALSKLGVLVDILKALVYLHAQDVIHRDLKAKNVMLNETFVAKVTDFGTSRETSEETMTSEIGTVAWIAPEVLKGVRYTEKADMYSLGVLISEMDMMEIPYSNIHRLLPESCLGVELAKTRIAMLVVAGELRPVFSTDCPAPILNVARRCLAYLPEDRPTAREVLSWLSPHLHPI